jgi:hypothetical protein
MLAWRELEPSGQVASSREGRSITHRCQELGGVDDADPRYGSQAPGLLVLAGEGGEIVVVGCDPSIQARPLVLGNPAAAGMLER